MSTANIICSICTEVFKNCDDVHSTTCGHLFHFSCLSRWQMRQKNCPQCRYENPGTHKLNLTFDESEKDSEVDEDFGIKLAIAHENMLKLQEEIKERKIQYSQLQSQFTATENTNLELEEKINTIKDMENEFMQLQAQYTETSELKKALEDEIDQLVVRNECQAQELKYKILENESIKAKIDSNQPDVADGILNGKINVLEQKIHLYSQEFEKEIKLSTQLSIENMKLQSQLKQLQNSL